MSPMRRPLLAPLGIASAIFLLATCVLSSMWLYFSLYYIHPLYFWTFFVLVSVIVVAIWWVSSKGATYAIFQINNLKAHIVTLEDEQATQMAGLEKEYKEELGKERQQHDNNIAGSMKLAERHRREAKEAAELAALLKQELTVKNTEMEALKKELSQPRNLLAESAWKGVLDGPTTAAKPPRHLLSCKTRGEVGGEKGYFALSSEYFKAYTLVIENVSWRDNPVPVYNVRASIEYRHRNGYSRIVLSPATWVTRDVNHSFRASVSIPPTPEEAQMGALVVLWEDKSEAKKKWALATPGAEDPKELTPGRWDVKIVLTADNCDTYSGTGGFTVMPDNQIAWGEPPVFTFEYEATASA